MGYVEEAKALVQNLDQRMGPSPYDIAWLARLKDPSTEEPQWPELITWLLDHQYPDGSFGSQIVYYHDRIICTLVAAMALRENGHSDQARRAVKRAELYLWQHLHLLARDPSDLVGFELLLPTLLGEARSLGLEVPTHACGYERLQTEKLKLIPFEMLYSPHATTVHSLEFLGNTGDADKLQQALAVNGSLGNSPATTAYYLLLGGKDRRALEYLETVQRHTGHVTIVYPFRTFEMTWVLNNLVFSGLSVTDLVGDEVWEALETEMETSGVGADREFGIPDGDTTSVCIRLLIEAGHHVDPVILEQFEDKEKQTFRTYHYERNASVSTNVHALEALRLMPDYPNQKEVIENITLMLLNKRTFKMYWTDKWHTSPYYTTAHALVGLLKEGAYVISACQYTLDWLLHTQRPDGSWGFFESGTTEETAYVLTALLHYYQYKPIDPDILHRGAAYLERSYKQADETSYPALWIEKCLYIPHDIVRSAILSALILYQKTFGSS
ncbi:MAG: prenyltransferase/squalene oxidase repeat-containing protein [Anaerolineae bacterium]|jgi:halimadienyl-diphosphate synthase|nr:prenyltransferase/squalene oxidase repeat-containing protein [Anaerolineae bacterium]